jgi:hypothetical protein
MRVRPRSLRIMYTFGLTIPTTAEGVLLLGISLVALWIVVSIPVYFAGKLIKDGRADFGSAMGATLGGFVFYLIVFWGGTFLLTPSLGSSALVISFALAILAWLAVYRSSFDTGWLGALGIVFVGWLVLIVADALLVAMVGVGIPKFYPF